MTAFCAFCASCAYKILSCKKNKRASLKLS